MSKNAYAEQHLRNAVLTAISGLGARLFRVNTGLAWIGNVEHLGPDTVYIRNARPIHMGLVKGGSDLIGWIPVTVTPDMVGERIAVFGAIELKMGRQTTTTEQDQFLSAVSAAGGAATVARSVEDAVSLVRAWLAGTPPVRADGTTRPLAAIRS
jgi:hypothetical protein